MMKGIEEITSHGIEVGVLNGGEILEYAIHNEYGTSRGIPSRPFFRQALVLGSAQQEIKAWIEPQIKKVLTGSSGLTFYTMLGEYLKSRLVLSIAKGNFAPNSPETLKRKKGSKQLVDTGALSLSMTYRMI